MLGSVLPTSSSAPGVFPIPWLVGISYRLWRCRRDPRHGNCPGPSAASCQLLWAPEIATASLPRAAARQLPAATTSGSRLGAVGDGDTARWDLPTATSRRNTLLLRLRVITCRRGRR